ncbi:UNVERIFIED_CONTAM: hypothetical protein FKN15_062899 [Acipenser sinensis]
MDDFDLLNAPQAPTGNGVGDEEDPAAAFLAQQESEIAGIENDEGFNILDSGEVPSSLGSNLTGDLNQDIHVDYLSGSDYKYTKDVVDVFEFVNVDLSDMVLLDANAKQNLLNFTNTGIVSINYEAYLAELNKGVTKVDLLSFANDLEDQADKLGDGFGHCDFLDGWLPTDPGMNYQTIQYEAFCSCYTAPSQIGREIVDEDSVTLCHTPLDSIDGAVNGDLHEECNGPSDTYAAISQVDRLQSEPESLRKWREEQLERLELLDANSRKQEVEWKEKAKVDLEEWYCRQDEQLEKTKVNNRAAEEALVTDIDEKNPGTEWERVARLCDFNPKSSKQAKDVSRMRSILISLKTSPLVH